MNEFGILAKEDKRAEEEMEGLVKGGDSDGGSKGGRDTGSGEEDVSTPAEKGRKTQCLRYQAPVPLVNPICMLP